MSLIKNMLFFVKIKIHKSITLKLEAKLINNIKFDCYYLIDKI